jgi:hypothetical protein
MPSLASAAMTYLRPDGDISNSGWKVVGAGSSWDALNDSVTEAQTPGKSDYVYPTTTANETLGLATTSLGGAPISGATAYGYRASGSTQVTMAVVDGQTGSVLASKTMSSNAWTSVAVPLNGSQAQLDDLRLSFSAAGSSSSTKVYAAFLRLNVVRVIFRDDFDGPAGANPDPAKWTVMNWCDNWGSASCNTSRADNVLLDGSGNLLVRAIREDYTDPYGNLGTWTSGRLETQNKFTFTYGTLKARIKVPAGNGLWPSFWTNGRTGWPASGEIDVMEFLGNSPAVYYCSVHGANKKSGAHVSTTLPYTSPSSLADDFHVYEAQWTASQVAFYVDGIPCGTVSTTGMKTFSPQHVLVGMGVGTDWNANQPDETTPSPAEMVVDWVEANQ